MPGYHEIRSKQPGKSVPLQRIGQPREIGVLAVMLASDASAYMTGQVIVFDGGVSAY